MIDEVAERYLHDESVDPDIAAEQRKYQSEEDAGATPGEKVPGFGSDLARIKAAAQTVVRKTATFEVPQRPGFTMRFRADIKTTEIDAFRDRSTKNGKLNIGLNAALLIAATNTAILQDGRVLTDADGGNLRMGHRELWNVLGVGTAADCVKTWMGSDGDMVSLGNSIAEAAGYAGNQIQQVDEDPTESGSQSF